MSKEAAPALVGPAEPLESTVPWGDRCPGGNTPEAVLGRSLNGEGAGPLPTTAVAKRDDYRVCLANPPFSWHHRRLGGGGSDDSYQHALGKCRGKSPFSVCLGGNGWEGYGGSKL